MTGFLTIAARHEEPLKESQVQTMARRSHVLEIGEDPTGFEQIEHLAIEGALALVLEMVECGNSSARSR